VTVEHAAPVGAVFLSYAREDTLAAQRITEALRAGGIEVWFDQSELRGGDAWDQQIRRQIKECALFVAIISAHTQERTEGYFRLEWHLAEQRTYLMAQDQPFLLPIVVDATPDAAARVPERFRERQWTRLPGGLTPPEFTERVQRLLGMPQKNASQDHAASPVVTPSDRATGSGHTAPRQSVATPRSRWLLPAGIALAAGIGLALWWSAKKPDTSVSAPEAQTLPRQGAEPVAGSASENEKSVAVLAFGNLSDDKDNEYFSDGISEELLNVLQKIPGLHVAARASAFSFKGKNATAQEIGAKLGVANLVEGSVQRIGSRVKVNASLSRVATGEELWSRSYTREVKDVFALQEQLALAIVGELRGRLPGGESTAAVKAAVKGGTSNPEAYQQYLQGRFYLNRFAEKPMRTAVDYFQKAVRLDPSFALGWAGLAHAHAWMCEFSTNAAGVGFNAHLTSAREAVARALALEPNLPEALSARAEIQLAVDFDWAGSAESLRRARELAPADPDLLVLASHLARAQGKLAISTDLLRQAVALDPVKPSALTTLAFGLVLSRQFVEARELYRRVQELNPAIPWAYAGPAYSYLLEKNYDTALSVVQSESAEWARLLIVSMARWGQGRVAESNAAVDELIRTSADTAAYQIAEAYAFRGDRDRSFQWLERARRQHDGGLLLVAHDPVLQQLSADTRWPAFLKSMGLADGG
jgi:TolB-like protein/tetratricopeptide (TPR) repeat protein